MPWRILLRCSSSNQLHRPLHTRVGLLICPHFLISKHVCHVSRFFCRSYADSATPNLGDLANICPAGFYCQTGTAEPRACPPGTFNPTPGIIAESDCLPCTGGFYCGEHNLTSPSGPCDPGFYCDSAADVSTFIGCPIGSYCPNASANYTLCPEGTFSNQTNMGSVDECTTCPGGFYCETQGLTSPTDECGEGYYCPPGSIEREPAATFCPIGHYCPTGQAQPLPCRNHSFVS